MTVLRSRIRKPIPQHTVEKSGKDKQRTARPRSDELMLEYLDEVESHEESDEEQRHYANLIYGGTGEE